MPGTAYCTAVVLYGGKQETVAGAYQRYDGVPSTFPGGGEHVISEGYVCEKIYAEPVRGLAYEY